MFITKILFAVSTFAALPDTTLASPVDRADVQCATTGRTHSSPGTSCTPPLEGQLVPPMPLRKMYEAASQSSWLYWRRPASTATRRRSKSIPMRLQREGSLVTCFRLSPFRILTTPQDALS
ncbi:hypothetical protein NEOLEDRAFT_1144552 [Neolentinus lepideus HHB14362 ss-1]|uniref:Uncharacterized protein n=1 Tax=Neolentinus lepideus HHB14362 ss-1 TaxID=1314782 RepID=A0A165VRI3_9AGAM|nr:hypothetical protein NEOLEDRAFT_1144552 [Neolentinus lepideus HHB14362 ss-1]